MSLAQSVDCEKGAQEDTSGASSATDAVSGRMKRPNKKLYQPPAASACPKSLPTSPTEPAGACDAEKGATNGLAEDASWDALYDDSGECIDSQLIKGFKTALNLADDKDLKFHKADGDYSEFSSSQSPYDLTDNEYPHVLEVYGFAEDLKTPDLFARIASAGSSDFEIVWVDETHALAVFGSQSSANTAIGFSFPDVKVRVLSQATRESKIKAKRCTDRLLPFKKRPQTSLDAARRLVGRHLGLKVHVSKEQLQAEKKLLQEAKDRRRQVKKQTNDIWEGNVN